MFLPGSWVEFHFSGAASQSISRHGSQELVMPTSTQQDDVENMLLDAQHESSRSSSGGSSECNRSVLERGTKWLRNADSHSDPLLPFYNSPRRALTPLVWRGSGGSSLQVLHIVRSTVLIWKWGTRVLIFRTWVTRHIYLYCALLVLIFLFFFPTWPNPQCVGFF